MSDNNKRQPKQAQYWVYTLNNPELPPDEHLAFVLDKAADAHGYHIFCHERGDSGTPHYQGYIELLKPKRLATVCKILGGHAHVEYRLGTQQEAIDYCKKIGKYADKAHTQIAGPFEYGTPAVSNQGARTDLDDAVEALRQGGLDKVAEDCPTVALRYHRGLEWLFERYSKKKAYAARTTPPEIWLHYGPPRKGKSRYFFDTYTPDQQWDDKAGAMQWFDGYEGQHAALFDDFDGRMSAVPLRRFLLVTDRYPRQLPKKGGHVWWYPRMIHVTTNYHPIRWYDWTERNVQYDSVKDRFTKVYYFDLTGELTIIDKHLDKELWDRFWSGPDSDNDNFTFL